MVFDAAGIAAIGLIINTPDPLYQSCRPPPVLYLSCSLPSSSLLVLCRWDDCPNQSFLQTGRPSPVAPSQDVSQSASNFSS